MWFMPFQIKRQTSAQSAQGIKAFWNKIWQKQLLKAHKDSKHNGIKYSCDECDNGANTKSILKVNIESKHQNEKKHNCNKCDYKATHRGSLRTHRKSHHEGLRYNCDQCYYRATQKGSPKTHIDSQHKGTSWIPIRFKRSQRYKK